MHNLSAYNIQETGSTFSFQPFKKEFPKNVLYMALAAVAGGIFIFFNANPAWDKIMFSLLALGAAYLIYWGLFVVRTTIVFDRENRTIFRQKGSGLKKILPFEEACLLLTETKGGCLYGIARKSDRYRSVQRLSGYMSEEELRAFEEEIAQKIQQMLEA